MRELDPWVTEFDRYFVYRIKYLSCYKKNVGIRSDFKITHSRWVWVPTNLKHRSIEAFVKDLQI